MRKHLLYILFLSSTLFSRAQKNSFVSVNNGFIETGVQYNGLITPYNPYPAWQYFTNVSQKISVAGVPLSMQGGFTNLLFSSNEGAWYPNFLKFTYNKQDFQKELQQRYIHMLEQKAVAEYEKRYKLNRNQLQIQQLNQWLTQADTNRVLHQIDSLNQEIAAGNNVGVNKKVLVKYQTQMKHIRTLYNKRAQLEKANRTLQVNDSIISALEKAQTTRVNFKQPEMVKLMNMSNFQQFMYSLDEMQAGRFYLDIKGISQYTNIDGLQVKIKPKHFYIHAVAGKIFQSNYFNTLMPNTINKNNTYVAGGSIGRKKGAQNIALHYYYFTGNTATINQTRNTVIGAEWQSKISNKGSIGILLTGSQSYNLATMQDTVQFQGIPVIYPVSVQNTVSDIFTQNKSVLYQTGYRLELNAGWRGIFTRNDSWKIKYERVSPFYQSMAMPFLWRDQHGVELQNRWAILKNTWRLQVNLEYKEDNLSKLNPTNTFWNIAGIRAIKQKGKLKTQTGYNLIARHNAEVSMVYHNVSQNILWQGKGAWQGNHAILGNVFWNDTTVVSQQYLYKIQVKPAKNWIITSTQGISYVYSTSYLNMQLSPAFQKNNYSLGMAYQTMINKNEQHHNVNAILDWAVSEKIQLHFETGFGRAPQWLWVDNSITFVNYWNGLISLKYNWK